MASMDAVTSRVPPSRNPFLLPLGIAAGLVALHLFGGAVVAPAVLRARIPALARERLHREASVAAVRVNPYAMRATLVGLALLDRDGTPLLSADTLVVDLAASSLVRRATVLDELRLVRPAATLRLTADGRPAVIDLLADSAAPATPGGLPRVVIGRASIRDGQVTLVDESRRPHYEDRFTELQLAIDSISTLPAEDGSHALTATFASGAAVTWNGRAAFDPLRLEGRFGFTRLQLPRIAEAFGGRLPLALVAGELAADVPYVVERAPGGGVVVRVPRLEAALSGIAARPRDATADWARAAAVEVSNATLRWPERTARVQAVSVIEPWLAVAREPDGRLSWHPVLDALPEDTAATAPAWAVAIDSVQVRNGTIEAADRMATPALALRLSPVNVVLTGVSTDSAAPVGVAMDVALAGGATARATGTVVRAPFSAALDLAMDDLDLRLAERYLPAGAPITIGSGRVGLQGKLALSPGRPATRFTGTASLRNVAVRDSTGEPLVTWRALQASGVEYTQAPDLLRVRRVVVQEPFARVAISRERELNLMQVSRRLMTDTAATEPLVPYEVVEIAFERGVVDFSDESLVLPFRTTIDSAHALVRDVASFGGTPGSLSLEGRVQPDGLARAEGSLQLADPFAATDVKVVFRNLDLSRFTPYSAQFAGYAIRSGRLDMDLHYRIRARALEADHHVVAKQLTLGDKVEGGESPGFLVKLAVSLMKDRQGNITLDVPVTGTVDDPQFSYRGIVWTAMKQMLGKVATAPFRFLGKLLGLGGDAPELVDFDPGRSDLIPPEREKLDSLAAELGRKPELLLQVEGRYDPQSDTEALREGKLQALLDARRDSLFKGKAPEDSGGTTLGRTLESLYASLHSPAALDSIRDSVKLALQGVPVEKGQRKPRRGYESAGYFEALRARMLADQAVDSTDLAALARARAEGVLAALLQAGLADSGRVELLPPAPVKRKKEGSPRIASELVMDAR
jgi:hypothetical protein